MEKKPLSFSHYAPAAQAGVCWYCAEIKWGIARYQIPRADPTIPGYAALAEVCEDCTPRAERGERGNG